ncbi:MAG TPA: ABC transporter permease, partial [Reyranella sp.]
MRQNRSLTATALIGPATIFIAVGLLAPLAILFRYSLNEFVPRTKTMVEALTVKNYITFFTDPYYTSALGTTIKIALLVTVACLVIGFPLAYVV